MERLQNIVVGVDFSDFSKCALAQAERIIRESTCSILTVRAQDGRG